MTFIFARLLDLFLIFRMTIKIYYVPHTITTYNSTILCVSAITLDFPNDLEIFSTNSYPIMKTNSIFIIYINILKDFNEIFRSKSLIFNIWSIETRIRWKTVHGKRTMIHKRISSGNSQVIRRTYNFLAHICTIAVQQKTNRTVLHHNEETLSTRR